jgi:peptidoglycan/LPS O-acetylase OafA/YrhL
MNKLAHEKYRPDIDGLRAVAIFAVVGYHAFPDWFRGGFIGVDIFFVISGYLISIVILRSLDEGCFSFLEFYARRIKRIFPALIFLFASCSIFGWLVLFPDEYKQLNKHITSGTIFISNFVLWNEAGYFDNSAYTKPLLHLWSLAIEEQFYILYPLFIWFSWKRKFNFFVIILAAITTSFALNIYGIRHDISATFYSPLTRIWELLIGGLLAYIGIYSSDRFDHFKINLNNYFSQFLFKRGIDNNVDILSNMLSLLGLSLLVYGFWRINKDTAFPGEWALLPVLATGLLIVAGSNAWVNRRILSNRIAIWFGLISFPLYLWHWPLLSFQRIIEGEVMSTNIRVVTICVSIFLSWLTYKIIENPIRGSSKKIVPIILLTMMTLIFCVSYNKFSNVELETKASIFTSQLGAIRPEFVQNSLCNTRYPIDFERPTGNFFCIMNKDEPPTLLLLGNSLANHHYPGFTANIELSNNVILSAGRSYFPVTNELAEQNKSLRSPFEISLSSERDWIDNIIRTSPSLRFAIIDGLLREPAGSAYIKIVKEKIDFLESRGIRVIVFVPHVIPYFDIRTCFSRFILIPSKHDCSFNVSHLEELKRNFQPHFDSIKKTNPNVLFFDQNVLFCRDNKCSYLLNGIPLSRDMNSEGRGGHFSLYASEELTKIFVEWARVNVPDMLR